MQIKSAKDLEVYKRGFLPAIGFFQLSKCFPSEEEFALTNQIRRSSRSICLNLREPWAKRRYEAHFIGKLTDLRRRKQRNRFIIGFRNGLGLYHTRTTVQIDWIVSGNRQDARQDD